VTLTLWGETERRNSWHFPKASDKCLDGGCWELAKTFKPGLDVGNRDMAVTPAIRPHESAPWMKPIGRYFLNISMRRVGGVQVPNFIHIGHTQQKFLIYSWTPNCCRLDFQVQNLIHIEQFKRKLHTLWAAVRWVFIEKVVAQKSRSVKRNDTGLHASSLL